MTTTAQATKPAATVERLIADLLITQTHKRLPAWLDVRAYSDAASLHIYLASHADVLAWHDALGGPRCARSTSTYEHRGPIHSAWLSRDGWAVTFRASIQEVELPAMLPDSTLVELGQLRASVVPQGHRLERIVFGGGEVTLVCECAWAVTGGSPREVQEQLDAHRDRVQARVPETAGA